MKFHRMGVGLLASASAGVLAVDGDTTAPPPPPPPTGTLTMTLHDFYRDPTHPADPVVQRKAGGTTANITVSYNFTGSAPTKPQAKVTKGGTTIIDWTTLTGIVNHATDGFGVLANVPQGVGYLLHIRDGLQPTFAPCISDGTGTWGVGVIVLLVGTTNMDRILSGGATTTVVPGSALTEANYYTGTPVHAAIFDEFGWHAPSSATNFGPFSGSVFAAMRILTAELKTLYTTDVPVGIVAWTAVASTGIEAFTGPTGAQYQLLIGANGTASGGIGMGSPGNYYGGDFEIILAHHGEANSADSATIYTNKLTAFYASMLAYVKPFSRGVNNLYYGLCLPGGYSALPAMENIRQTIATYVRSAFGAQPHVDLGCDCLDLHNDGTYLDTSAGQMRAMRRLLQGALQFLGCSAFGSSGPTLAGYSISGTVVTFNVVHDGGTALELAAGGGITGFTVNTAADFSGSNITPTSVALANSNTQIAITLPGGTTFPVYVRYLAGSNPSIVNPVFDNANYPDGTTGTDVEAVGFPLQPSGGSLAVATQSGLTATIAWADGTQTVYSAATATDKGDYTDPAGLFVQGSLLATDPSKPAFRVWFRSNKSGSTGYFPYDSVIFEWGDTFQTSPAPSQLPPYTATIRRNTTVLSTTTLPANVQKDGSSVGHYWSSRWRWQSAPFPTNRLTRAQLISQKWVPNGWNTAFRATLPTFASFTYSPMTLAGLTPAEDQTGGRNDIGFYTGWAMHWLWSGDATMFSTMMAQAEASGTWPFHYRQPSDQGVIDLQAYPNASYAAGGSPHIVRAGGGNYNGGALNPERGHKAQMCFIPFLLSGDPYFLEELQFAFADSCLEVAAAGRGAGIGRYYAWPLRDALMCAVATPASVPSWLRPKANQVANLSYFSDDMTVWANKGPGGVGSDFAAYVYHITRAGGARSYVNDLVTGTYFVPWQESYVDISHSFALIWGFTQFTVPFQWHLQNNLDRCNGTSGWPRVYADGYQLGFRWGTTLKAAMDATTPTPLISTNQTAGAPASGNFVLEIENEDFLVHTVAGSGFQVVTRAYNGTAAHTHAVNKEVYAQYFNTWAEAFTGDNIMWTDRGKPMLFAAGDPTGSTKLMWPGGGLGSNDYTGSHYYSLIIINAVPSGFFLSGQLADAQQCLTFFRNSIPEAQIRYNQGIPFDWIALPWP